GKVPNEILATAFFAHSTDLVARMAKVLGRADEAKRYAALAEEIRKAFLRAFVEPDGRMKGDAQGGYALALRFDLAREPAMRRAMAARMVERLEPYGGHLSTGIQTTARAMLEFTRNGYDDIAYRVLGLRTVPSWRYMLEHDATTIWERWDGFVDGRGFQDPGMNSFNHYALGAIGEWIIRTIAGISPDEEKPGYEHVVVRPRPGSGLTFAAFLYRSIRGPIRVAWRIEKSGFVLHVEIPANAAATVYVPAEDPRAVTESGEPARDAEGVEFLRAEEGCAVFRIGSGSYAFAVRG
ncbi:MAG: alpha-L-rhamnosidase, partial [Planctomycetes bacterium]|nr:alpha-L-rhamnosidase [Planctomycetota bacterium]